MAVLGSAAAAPIPGVTADPGRIELVESDRDGRRDDLTVFSPALDAATRVRVLLPNDYDTAATEYPVVYMLHGLSGTWEQWVDQIGADAITDGYPAIFVMPDADGGFYADFHNRGRYGPPAYETYHVDELVEFVRTRYRTDPARTAIIGRSFGGFGSMSYAARHPDVFRVAVSFSGMVDTMFAPPITELGLAAFYQAALGPRPDVFFGDPLAHNLLWRARNPTELVSNLSNTSLYVEWGNGTPRFEPVDIADVFIEIFINIENRSFSRALSGAGVDHVRIARRGAHQWQEYIASLEGALPVVMDELERRGSPPTSFDFKSIDPVFEIWTWDFAAERSAAEFLELEDVDRDGFTIEGSGRVTVSTPPVYCPGASYPLAGATSAAATAGPNGRITFIVDLGASNRFEAFSFEAVVWEALTGGRNRTARDIAIDAVTGDRDCA